jgi:hypothetical protein
MTTRRDTFNEARSIRITVFNEDTGVRVRCEFCGAILFQRETCVEVFDLPQFSAEIFDHFSDTQPHCPSVKS